MALTLPVSQRPPPQGVFSPKPRITRRRRVVAAPRLSVVIVNYWHWEDTAALVRQLLAAESARTGDAEVVVVDNHSPPHRLARRVRRWPGVSLRRWGRNRGFARAVNEGCRLSQGDWLLLLNPDTTVSPDFLDGVLRMAEKLSVEEPRTGIVGFQLRNDDGTRQFSSGPEPTLARTLAGLLLPRARRKYHRVSSSRRRPVPWVTGCCLLVRRDCLEQVGGLDEDYFLYYEDVDLCRRARSLGWSVCYDPSLRVVHHRPLHGRDVPPHLRVLTRHALLTYAAKHWPRWQFRLLSGIVGLEAWWRRRQSGRRGNRWAAKLFGELGALTTDLSHGRPQKARRRLRHLVRREELRLAS